MSAVEAAQKAVDAAELELVTAGREDLTLLLVAIATLGRARSDLARAELAAGLMRPRLCSCDRCSG